MPSPNSSDDLCLLFCLYPSSMVSEDHSRTHVHNRNRKYGLEYQTKQPASKPFAPYVFTSISLFFTADSEHVNFGKLSSEYFCEHIYRVDFSLSFTNSARQPSSFFCFSICVLMPWLIFRNFPSAHPVLRREGGGVRLQLLIWSILTVGN